MMRFPPFGHPFRRFPPFRLPISKVSAFPVTHFEGSRLSGHPFQRFPPFWSPILKVSAFLITHFEGFGFRSTSTGRNWRVASPFGRVFGRTELVLWLFFRFFGSWTEFRGSRHHFEDSGVLKSCERNWVPDLNDPRFKVPSGSQFGIGIPGLISNHVPANT
ncbi:unnamed protein product [Rhizophagus irregularis]|nr:unnamed protein product [Rhizophagus irregularis]